jgi:hypothetical protein
MSSTRQHLAIHDRQHTLRALCLLAAVPLVMQAESSDADAAIAGWEREWSAIHLDALPALLGRGTESEGMDDEEARPSAGPGHDVSSCLLSRLRTSFAIAPETRTVPIGHRTALLALAPKNGPPRA